MGVPLLLPLAVLAALCPARNSLPQTAQLSTICSFVPEARDGNKKRNFSRVWCRASTEKRQCTFGLRGPTLHAHFKDEKEGAATLEGLCEHELRFFLPLSRAAAKAPLHH